MGMVVEQMNTWTSIFSVSEKVGLELTRGSLKLLLALTLSSVAQWVCSWIM